MLFIGHWYATAQCRHDGNSSPIYSPKIILKTISTKHSQQFKAFFKLKYLGSLEAVNLVKINVA